MKKIFILLCLLVFSCPVTEAKDRYKHITCKVSGVVDLAEATIKKPDVYKFYIDDSRKMLLSGKKTQWSHRNFAFNDKEIHVERYSDGNYRNMKIDRQTGSFLTYSDVIYSVQMPLVYKGSCKGRLK